MAERVIENKLKELYDSGKNVYSISKLNTIDQCKYQAYLSYIKKEPKPGKSIYGILGGKIHDKLEEIIKGTAEPKDIKPVILEELDDLEMFGIEFPKDRNGNDIIKNNWVANMTRFADEFIPLDGTFLTEQLLTFKITDNDYMMGYADVIGLVNDKDVWLLDWKTSAKFDKNHLIPAGRQLIVYKKALEEQGYNVVRCSWAMLKYCETTWKLKNGNIKSKVSEWRNLIKDLKSPIIKELEDNGYSDIDIEIMYNEGLEMNTWEAFPECIRNKFTTKCYIRDYEITEELEEECSNYINEKIMLYNTLGEDENNWKPCNIKEQTYFCSNLCDYGGKKGTCKYWRDFCDSYVAEEPDDENLF